MLVCFCIFTFLCYKVLILYMYILNKLKWIFYYRYLLKIKLNGFDAHRTSYANSTCVFKKYTRLFAESVVVNSDVGRYTYIAGARVANASVGPFCSIGPEAIVGGLGRHPINYLSTHPVFYSANNHLGISFIGSDLKIDTFDEFLPVVIGADVWIGARAIILDGIEIGHGAIIAAGAVVTKNVPPYAIVGGVPAKLIKFRFSEAVINELLINKWWELDEQKIKEYLNVFNNKYGLY